MWTPDDEWAAVAHRVPGDEALSIVRAHECT
jgi:hypothetical protein